MELGGRIRGTLIYRVLSADLDAQSVSPWSMLDIDLDIDLDSGSTLKKRFSGLRVAD